MSFEVENYLLQNSSWPVIGCHVLANFDDESIIVYQAFKKSIAEYAVSNNKFGGPDYNFNRMSWIKTNFLWMMFRSGWASKTEQEHILAIHISLTGFEWILQNAYSTRRQKSDCISNEDVFVRLQWDPDHDVFGTKQNRRAIQLGLRSIALRKFNDEFILKIEDITDFVKEQYKYVEQQTLENLSTPREMVYVPKCENTVKIMQLNDLH